MMGFSIYEDNDVEDDEAEPNVQQLELQQHAVTASSSGAISSALNFSILDDDDDLKV
jgi:hypothetical protein